MTKVLLVDDHPIVRAGLRALLGALDDIEIAAEAADGAEAIAKVEALDVDVVLMDLQMGAGMDGVSATRTIKQRQPHLPVLILTTFDTDADILAALEAGASGYLLKDAPVEQIGAAIRQAAAGQSVLAPEVASRLMGRIQNPGPSLTGREIELLELIGEGLTNRAAAKRLYVSEATIKTHLVHIFSKLGVDNRTAAVRKARDLRIIRGG